MRRLAKRMLPAASTITIASGADSRTLASSVEEGMHHQLSAGSRIAKQAPQGELAR